MHMLFSETRSLVLSCYASKQSETSTFKRDKLGTATNADYRIIASGNTLAHAGDAVVDAGLYKGGGGRWDVSTYERLYGDGLTQGRRNSFVSSPVLSHNSRG